MSDLRIDLAVLDILQILSNKLDRIEEKLDRSLIRLDLDDPDLFEIVDPPPPDIT